MPETIPNNTLAIQIGLQAAAQLQPEALTDANDFDIDISLPDNSSKVSVTLDVTLAYSTLAAIITATVQHKKIQARQAFFHLDITIHKVTLSGSQDGRLHGEAHFAGTHDGVIYFTGVPVLDAATNSLEVKELTQQIKTNSILINVGKWLFKKKIESELKKLTTVDLSTLYAKLSQKIEAIVNKQWSEGIVSKGSIQKVKATNLTILAGTMLLQLILEANVKLLIDTQAWSNNDLDNNREAAI